MDILNVNGTGINDDRHKVRTGSVVSDDKLRRKNEPLIAGQHKFSTQNLWRGADLKIFNWLW
jgi:hypothetical protein